MIMLFVSIMIVLSIDSIVPIMKVIIINDIIGITYEPRPVPGGLEDYARLCRDMIQHTITIVPYNMMHDDI